MSPSAPTVAPHRLQCSGTGTPLNPARERCTTCGWVSADFYGKAATSRAALAGKAHQRCEACEGSRHRPGGEPCPVCDGSGWRPPPPAPDAPGAVL